MLELALIELCLHWHTWQAVVSSVPLCEHGVSMQAVALENQERCIHDGCSWIIWAQTLCQRREVGREQQQTDKAHCLIHRLLVANVPGGPQQTQTLDGLWQLR